ncbi:uncharacterized protein [Arachis hypogaea]|uniref:uncharacterized protein n=1 Tax=Arachis hypogaea TaxID=3818 RepID=UPI003B21C2DF
MDKVFQKQIGKNKEVYMDDMVVKSNTEKEHLTDLKKVFDQLRKYNMRLNPEKCAFGVQGGRLAALSRFLPTMAARSGHFFNTLRKSKKFKWTKKYENAFAEFKQILSLPHMLAKPKPGNPLYLSATKSSILRQQNFAKRRNAIFDHRKAGLCPSNHSETPKALFSKPQDHSMNKPTTKSSLKSQALDDFVAELTSSEDIHPEWELYVDGASNEDDGGAGIVLKDKEGISTEKSIKYMFLISNNQSEYEALLAGMRLAKECGIQNIKVYCDSLFVVQQVNDVFQREKSPKLFQRRASIFTIIGDDLYRRGFSRPLLKCLGDEEATLAMEEAHEGICGTHIGGRSLSTKILRAGYYWP